MTNKPRTLHTYRFLLVLEAHAFGNAPPTTSIEHVVGESPLLAAAAVLEGVDTLLEVSGQNRRAKRRKWAMPFPHIYLWHGPKTADGSYD